MSEWHAIETAPLGIEVMTKIDDAHGCRNEQPLVQKQRTPETRPMWWTPDGSMYVYYTPTHWQPLTPGTPA
jgi:hypothetical protein